MVMFDVLAVTRDVVNIYVIVGLCCLRLLLIYFHGIWIKRAHFASWHLKDIASSEILFSSTCCGMIKVLKNYENNFSG